MRLKLTPIPVSVVTKKGYFYPSTMWQLSRGLIRLELLLSKN